MKKGMCEDKKTWKKCMETCKKCPGATDNFQLFDRNNNIN